MTESTHSFSGNSENNAKNKNKKSARPVADLLLEISCQADDRETAVKAFNEIIKRFKDYLEYACRKYLFRSSGYDETEVVVLMNNTFLRLYDKSEHLLHIDSLKTENEKEAVVKQWLSTVASREAFRMKKAKEEYYDRTMLTDFNAYPKSKGDEEDDDDQDNEMLRKADPDNETESLTSDEMIIFTEVLNECTSREKEIILTYYEFLDGRKHLPPDEQIRLCSMFNILYDNLNQIKYRTFKKIKSESLRRMEMRNPGYRIRE
jgi:DNA-directed RNA polymerase specialized sigma24 family protein